MCKNESVYNCYNLNDPVFGADLPGGKIRVGETDFIKSLRREVFEETGFKIQIDQPFHTGYLLMPHSVLARHRKIEGKLTFLVFFTAQYVSGILKLSDEHDSYTWVDKNGYLKLIEDKLGNTKKALKAYFSLFGE